MKVFISPRAEKQLKKLPKFDQLAVIQKIRHLTNDTDLLATKLSGFKDIYRIRVGDYRLVYRRQPSEIYVVLIQHRKEVYRVLRELLG